MGLFFIGTFIVSLVCAVLFYVRSETEINKLNKVHSIDEFKKLEFQGYIFVCVSMFFLVLAGIFLITFMGIIIA